MQRSGRIYKFAWTCGIGLAFTVFSLGQTYTIETFAGGGTPENLPAISAALGGIAGMATDGAGNLYLALGTYSMVVRIGSDGLITRVAGNGSEGFSGDGGPAVNAQLSILDGLAFAPNGDLYLADWGNQRIRKVANGIISTVVGGGTLSYSAAPVPATGAVLTNPFAITFDSQGDLIVLDGNSIAKVSGGMISAVGNVQTIVDTAGYGGGGVAYGVGNAIASDSTGKIFVPVTAFPPNPVIGNPPVALIAVFGGAVLQIGANGLAIDSNDNLYYTSGNAVWQVGTATPVVGKGIAGFSGDGGPAAQAELNDPTRIAFDSQNNLYIVDSGNQRVRKVSNGVITTVAGATTGALIGDGGPAGESQLNPVAAAVAPDGSLYVADPEHSRIRRVADGVITTVAGNGNVGFGGDNGPATAGELNFPAGVAVDSSNNVFVADTGNSRVREISNGQITTAATLIIAPQSVAIGLSGSVDAEGGPGIVWTIVNGTVAQIPLTVAPGVTLATDAAGNIYSLNQTGTPSAGGILEISNGVATVIAFTGPGVTSLAVDPLGTVYYSQGSLVYKVSNGVGTVIAGGGSSSQDGVPALSASLIYPMLLAAAADGTVFMTGGPSGPRQIRTLTPEISLHTPSHGPARRPSTPR